MQHGRSMARPSFLAQSALKSFVSHCNYLANIHFVNHVSNELPTIAGVDVGHRFLSCSFLELRHSGPVCRGCYRVPFAGVGSFEVNRTIVNLLESLPHTESKPMLKAKCALCKFEDTITVRRQTYCWQNVHLLRLGMWTLPWSHLS